MKGGYNLRNERGYINHLLFMNDLKVCGKDKNQVDTLVQTVREVSSNMCIEFDITKCAMLIMKRGKLMSSDGIRSDGYI